MKFSRFLFAALVLPGMVSSANAQGNMALKVNGTGGYLKITKDASLEPPNAITVESWLNVQSSVGHGMYLRKAGEFANGYNFSWSFQNSPFVSGTIYCNNATLCYDNVPKSTYLNAWHHVAMTYDSATNIQSLYVDGVLHNAIPGPGCIKHTDHLFIGSYHGLEGINGLIDEVRIWDYARSEAQIKSAMGSYINSAPGLISSWHMDGSGIDSASTNDGTLLGTASFVPSDSPVGFQFEPKRGSWLGGTVVRLIGAADGLPAVPQVSFGEAISPSVVIDGSDVVAVAPAASAPGVRVVVSVDAPGFSLVGSGEFQYTPRLDIAPTTVMAGDEFDTTLLFDPPAHGFFLLGTWLPRPVAGSGVAWQIELVPELRLFGFSGPLQNRLTFTTLTPELELGRGVQAAIQALVLSNDASKPSSYSNTVQFTLATPPR